MCIEMRISRYKTHPGLWNFINSTETPGRRLVPFLSRLNSARSLHTMYKCLYTSPEVAVCTDINCNDCHLFLKSLTWVHHLTCSYKHWSVQMSGAEHKNKRKQLFVGERAPSVEHVRQQTSVVTPL